MKKQKLILRQAVLASLLTAMITVLTCWLKIPIHNGYLHIGDSVICIAACLLPAPLALFCGSVGGMLADLIGGYSMYAIPSFIIKALLVLAFDSKSEKLASKRNVAAAGIGAAITVTGYYITDVILTASAAGMLKEIFSTPVPWTSALYSASGNLIQGAASAVIFILLATALDKVKIRQKLL